MTPLLFCSAVLSLFRSSPRASGRSRTDNPRITNAVLCQLKLRWRAPKCDDMAGRDSAESAIVSSYRLPINPAASSRGTVTSSQSALRRVKNNEDEGEGHQRFKRGHQLPTHSILNIPDIAKSASQLGANGQNENSRRGGLTRRSRQKFATGKSSPGRTRTYDLAVNSRSLYQLSYRGSETSILPTSG
jgi:hypothetical protein